MGIIIKLVSLAVLAGIVGFMWLQSSKEIIPKYENTWWGPDTQQSGVDKWIKPFKIVWEDKVIYSGICYMFRVYYFNSNL